MIFATRSSPCEIWILSTDVRIAGNVLSTSAVGTPGLNGVYFFGSHVSVCAIPPAIHSTIVESAVATGAAAARTSSGSPPISAASEAAAVVPINPRRLIRELMYFSSLVMTAFYLQPPFRRLFLIDQLKLRLHHHSPQQIRQTLRAHL